MICYAVPTLKKNIKGAEEKIPNYSIPKNDLFTHDMSNNDQLKELAKDYKQRLTLIFGCQVSAFSKLSFLGRFKS